MKLLLETFIMIQKFLQIKIISNDKNYNFWIIYIYFSEANYGVS